MLLIFLLILLSSPFIIFTKTNDYNLTLGNPLNITNLKQFEYNKFYLEVNYPQELKIKLTIPNEIETEELQYKKIYVEEENSPQGIYHYYPFYQNSIKYYPDKTVRIMLKHFLRFQKTKRCIIYFRPNYNLTYLNIIVDSANPFYIQKGISQKFNNILEYYNYQFFLGVERFQRINVTITAKSTELRPFNHVNITEYLNKTLDYYYNYNIISTPFYYDLKNDIYHQIISINLIYDIQTSNKVSLLLNFKCDLDYIEIYFESIGGEIILDDNKAKNIQNIKENIPYFFSTKTNLFQTSLITLRIKNCENNPIDYFDICGINENNNLEIGIIEKQIQTKQINDKDKNELIMFYNYQVNNPDITRIGFKIIPKFDLDYIIAKIENMGGTFFMNNEEIKKFDNIYPESEFYFWVKASQFQKINVNLNINSNKENPINYIDIYEYYCPSINCDIYWHINQLIIPEIKHNNQLSITLSYLVNDINTKYVLFKMKNKKYIESLEIKFNTKGNIYYLKDDTPMYITNIKAGNLSYFFISANKYNELFMQFNFKKEYTDPFKYITINEYENKNNVKFIKSSEHSYEIKLNQNESNIINLTYKPSCSLSKYIAFIVEANCDIDYLETKIVVGGGCYELNKYININKMIAGTVYYFPIKIKMFQKIEMKIILENIDSIKPFSFANIYEKQKKDGADYNKYHKQSLIKILKSSYLEHYFTYTIENFTTNYILMELIPESNIKNLTIKTEIINCDYTLYNGVSKNINKIMENTPYYYYIHSKQFQQVNINLTVDYKQNAPFNYVEIYELIDKNAINSAKKYINKTINFKENNNILTTRFDYMIQTVYTNYIIVKILPKTDLDFLNIKMDVGGGYYNLEKDSTKNITNLFPEYSYYCFVLCSKGEKLNFKLIINSNETEEPFNALNVYEYSNKNYPSIYLQNSAEKFNTEIKGNQSITFISYKTKNKDTNYIALEIIPHYNISLIECSIESEIDDNSSSFSIVKVLTIILIVIVFITTMLFVIYIKRKCMGSSSDSIEVLYNKNKDNKTNINKLELTLINVDSSSSLN